MTQGTKSILTSKVMWTNVISLIVIMANREVEVIDPASVDAFAIAAVTIANVFLRTVTTKPVHVLRGTGDGGPR